MGERDEGSSSPAGVGDVFIGALVQQTRQKNVTSFMQVKVRAATLVKVSMETFLLLSRRSLVLVDRQH